MMKMEGLIGEYWVMREIPFEEGIENDLGFWTRLRLSERREVDMNKVKRATVFGIAWFFLCLPVAPALGIRRDSAQVSP